MQPKKTMQLALLCFFAVLENAHGYWIKRVSELRLGLKLPAVSEEVTVRPASRDMKARLTLSVKDVNSVERPVLSLKNDHDLIFDVVNDVAKKGHKFRLYKQIMRQKQQHPRIRMDMDPHLLESINLERFIEYFHSYPHQRVLVDSRRLRANRPLVGKLLRELRWFLDARALRKVKRKIKGARVLNVEKDLLPRFARRVVRSFNRSRGPNCFHAAVSFQDGSIPGNEYFNVNREMKHHKVMINFDELWRILKGGFYPIDPRQAELKYGDVLVFFDLPKEFQEGQEIRFRWIKHATVYLFNDFTFAKGSKSANTPYTINKLKEEWTKWRNYTKNLAVRIFRKGQVQVRNLPREDRLDWLY